MSPIDLPTGYPIDGADTYDALGDPTPDELKAMVAQGIIDPGHPSAYSDHAGLQITRRSDGTVDVQKASRVAAAPTYTDRDIANADSLIAKVYTSDKVWAGPLRIAIAEAIHAARADGIHELLARSAYDVTNDTFRVTSKTVTEVGAKFASCFPTPILAIVRMKKANPSDSAVDTLAANELRILFERAIAEIVRLRAFAGAVSDGPSLRDIKDGA